MRFYLKLLKKIIQYNVGKSIQILLIIILLSIDANLNSKTILSKRIIHEFKDTSNGNWVYVEASPTYSSTSFDKRQYIYRDKTIRYFDYNGLFIFLIVISVGAASFMDDADWEIDKCISKTYLPYVKMDYENTQNGIEYTYSFKGRLLCKSHHMIDNYHLENKISGVLETPNLYLPYDGTKSEIRNNKLDNILK